MSELITPIPESHKNLYIPTYPDSTPYVYWHLSKQKEAQLELPKLETADTFQTFRVWITTPVGRKSQPHGLINIICEMETCTGTLFLMKVDISNRNLSETIKDKKVRKNSKSPKIRLLYYIKKFVAFFLVSLLNST